MLVLGLRGGFGRGDRWRLGWNAALLATRLVYMNDPKTIDKQLENAAKDAAEQFKAIEGGPG